MAPSTISRFVTGDYLAPASSRFAGQRVVAVAYLIRHSEATLLFDTGFPFDAPTSVSEGTDEEPIPTYPRPLDHLLDAHGTSLAELDLPTATCISITPAATSGFRPSCRSTSRRPSSPRHARRAIRW